MGEGKEPVKRKRRAAGFLKSGKTMGVKRGKYRGIPIYYDPVSHEMMGRNWFSDVLLDFNLWFDVHVVGVDSFEILLEDDEDKDENLWI